MSKNIYILNMNANDMFEILDNGTTEAELILQNIVITSLCMMIISQITISAKPEDAEYVDKLPSCKDIKKKFLTSEVGRSFAAVAGIAAAYPYLLQDPTMVEESEEKLIQIIIDMVDNPSPNLKRIRPTIEEWAKYAKGEAGAALGQIISCPSTNFKTVNIDPGVNNFGILEAIDSIGIKKEILNKYNITSETISKAIKNKYLIDDYGLPSKSVEYPEPNIISSKIQQEILGDQLLRNGTVGTKLIRGMELDMAITKAALEKYLKPKELIAYKFAINTGDKNILRKYTEMVKNRAKEDKSK